MRDFSLDLTWVKIQMAFAALGGWLGCFLGGLDGLLIALVVFSALDYLSGVLCAVSSKTLSSEVGFKGLARKALIFALVGMGHMIDQYVVGTGSALRSAIICFYLTNEGVSMLENAARLGLPVPDRLRAALVQIHGEAPKPEQETKET